MEKRWIITVLCSFVLLSGVSFAAIGSSSVFADMSVTETVNVSATWVGTGTSTIGFGSVPAGLPIMEDINIYITHNMGAAKTFSLGANVTKPLGGVWDGRVTLNDGLEDLVWLEADFGFPATFANPIGGTSESFLKMVSAIFDIVAGQDADNYSFQIELIVTSL